MSKPGARCKEEQEYFHWNHIYGQDKHFFKVMIGDFSEEMTLPDEFLQHLRGKVPRTIKLESRYGCAFDVQVTKNLGKLSLQSGWKAFVSAHDLEMGDFLVFKYVGISKFKVLIFGPSGCEKMPSYLTLKSSRHHGERWEEPLEIPSSSHDLPVKSPQCVSRSQTQWDSLKQENDTASIGDVGSDGDDLEANSVPRYILPIRTYLTDVQKEQLERKVRAIHSEIPIYGCILCKGSIRAKSCALDIVREYADVYLPFQKQTMILQRHGKNWEVQCHVKDRGRKRFLKGWKYFARDNNLHLGDVCLFELLEVNGRTMNVHIIRHK